MHSIKSNGTYWQLSEAYGRLWKLMEAYESLWNFMEIFRHSKSAFVRLKRANWLGGTDTQTDRHTDTQTEVLKNRDPIRASAFQASACDLI